jgi:hypothetical protein
MYSHSINYPYGEVSFYTQAQPVVFGAVKTFSNHVVDITPYTIGIINVLMISSIVLAAIFLYLLLAGTGLPFFYSALTAVGIAFLSPQIDRFSGHFTLGYVFAIPLLLYLLQQFHQHRRKILYSLIIGIVLFVLMTGHVYFVAFFAFVVIIYWLFILFSSQQKNTGNYFQAALHLSLQLILPVLLFYLMLHQYAGLAPDRPSKPYGFLVYKASPESVFLPIWTEYGRFLGKIRDFSYVQWEGVSYVGLVATIGFIILMIRIFKNIFRKKWSSMLQVTDNTILNVLFWSSFLALLYSFGIPFIFGLQFLVEYLGPLQQLRAIGRFAWLFYFVVNLVVFYNLWHWVKPGGRLLLKTALLLLGIMVLYAEVYFFLKTKQVALNNTFTSWSDTCNKNPENLWVDNIDPDQYQAVLPLPFYHMGSDNYGIAPRCDMLANSLLVSMKTGIPVAAIYMSRASISQSLKNIALVMEPYRKLEIMKDLPNRKPFLVVAARCDDYTPDERNVLRQGVKIDSNASFYLCRLEYDSLLKIQDKRAREIQEEFEENHFLLPDTFYLSDSTAHIVQVDYNDGVPGGYHGNALKTPGHSRSLLYKGPLNKGNHQDYILSFWLNPIHRDLFPKTRVLIACFDSMGNRIDNKNIMAGHFLRTMDGPWGLIEYKFQLVHGVDLIKISVENQLISTKDVYLIDEMLLRPERCNVYLRHESQASKNSRWYQVFKENSAIMEVPGQ